MTHGIAATVPLSPTLLAPSGFLPVVTGWLAKQIGGASMARGIA
jgi:hypothetical protein